MITNTMRPLPPAPVAPGRDRSRREVARRLDPPAANEEAPQALEPQWVAAIESATD